MGMKKQRQLETPIIMMRSTSTSKWSLPEESASFFHFFLERSAPLDTPVACEMKSELAASVDWNEFNKELTSVVNGDNYCSRRQAMTRAAAVAAGVALTTVSSPAFAAETKVVQMGTDSGGLKFVPE